MTRIITYTITEADIGKTILDFLKAHGYSHAVLSHLKKTPESILLDGVWEHMTAVPAVGDTLIITLKELCSSPRIIPEHIPLNIIYEDADILILNKSAGMPVHPSLRHPTGTLANAVCGYFAMQGIPYTFRCVNRLDRDTTGLVILAKHMLSSAILSSAVATRAVHREYLAIAEGKVPESGIVDAPIARKDAPIARKDAPIARKDNPIARKGIPTVEREVDFSRGERAITHYKRLSYAKHPLFENGLSLLSLHLETGRTHQIRVHMKYLGHPLIGDSLYNPVDSTVPYPIKRQALHSYRLQFVHPVTGRPMEFTAPLPADMLQFFPDASHRIP